MTSLWLLVCLKSYLFGTFIKDFSFWSHCTAYERSQFSNQGSDLYPLNWEHRVLTTGPPEKSLQKVVECNSGGLVAKSCPTLATPWTVARQAPLTMQFPGQEYRSELPFPSPGDFPHPGIEPTSPALQVDSLLLSHQGRFNVLYLPQKNNKEMHKN